GTDDILTMFSNASVAYSMRDAVLFDVVGALVVHAFYNRYEVYPSHLALTLVLLGAVPSISTVFLTSHIESVIAAIMLSFSLFYAAMLASIVIYRISPFHPLSRYPGPLLAKISKFYGIWKASSGKNHIFHKEIHERYGPYVRVGPNELSIADADYLSTILGVEGLPKGPMWEARRNPRGVGSLIATQDPQEHARRRKPWNLKRALQLVEELEKRSTRKEGASPVLNLAEWMRYFTFDFMGDMVFGGAFETMRDGADDVPIWHAIESGLKILAMMHHVPWLAAVLHKLPGSTEKIDRLRRYTEDAARKRKRNGSNVKDLFHHLIDEEGVGKEPPTEAEVLSDGILAIIAGSDTTAFVLSGLLYNLLLHPEDYRRLQKEVDEYFPPSEGDPFDTSKLSEMPFLNAVINEALRISPPGNILQRGTTVSTGGRRLGNNYIPKGTAVDVSMYALFRDPRYFSPAPEEFWPDRWLPDNMKKRTPKQALDANSMAHKTESGITMNAAAFFPFSYGPANCAGRSLALIEMRMVIAVLVQRFDMRLKHGYDPSEWHDKVEDWFVMTTGELPAVLTCRT
ncbi:hypothetical protein EW145_g7714, partial [Phellinidium pouzarii]